MPANKINFIVLHKGDSQVYGSSTKEIALSSPPPKGFTLEDKRVLFMAMHPDTGDLVVHELPRDEVLSAEIVERKVSKKKSEPDD